MESQVLQKLVHHDALLAIIRMHLVNPVSEVRKDALMALGQLDVSPSTVLAMLTQLADQSSSSTTT